MTCKGQANVDVFVFKMVVCLGTHVSGTCKARSAGGLLLNFSQYRLVSANTGLFQPIQACFSQSRLVQLKPVFGYLSAFMKTQDIAKKGVQVLEGDKKPAEAPW